MSEIDAQDEAFDAAAPSPLAVALRKKIGWLCQTIRFAMVAWSGWILVETVQFWSDREKLSQIYARAFEYTASPIADFNYYAACAMALLGWALTAFVAAALWKLFSRYLAGETFTVAAANDLRRLAAVGALTEVYAIAHRPVVYWLVNMGHEAKHTTSFIVGANDLLNAIFVTFLFSLAYIFKTAAELAEDHAQIV